MKNPKARKMRSATSLRITAKVEQLVQSSHDSALVALSDLQEAAQWSGLLKNDDTAIAAVTCIQLAIHRLRQLGAKEEV